VSKAQKALDPKPREENVNFGLDDKARETIAQNLSAILADTYALLVKTHIYHWNVVGPLFHSIHEMTEEQYNDLFKATDEIAERIRALGYRAPVVGNKGHDIVIELGAESKTAHEMIEDLISEHESTIRKMREAAEVAEEADDFVSHDMLVGRMTIHEKTVWMLRALVTD
jgi:starvation-inducible DNA-binding protein